MAIWTRVIHGSCSHQAGRFSWTLHDLVNNTFKTQFSCVLCGTILSDEEEKPEAKAEPAPKSVDTTNWKAWRHNVPGECPCGVPRAVCEYHK